MPKKLINDYIFYKIVCISDDIDLCYIGSTANWKERQRTHKLACNNENISAYNTKIYQAIRANGGWENFKMVQLGTREQLTKREAEQVEEEYRQELKANMNTKRCYITEEQKQEYKKEYYETNKEIVNEVKKDYYETNKEWFLEQAKEYRETNREIINEKASEKVKCECCNLLMRKNNLSRHKKTEKYLNNMNNI